MPKMYVATIMNRIVLGDGDYIFYVSHPAIGTLDDETKIFKDRNGCEYAKMLDASLLMSEVSRAYYNLQPLDKIQDVVNAKTVQDAIADYAYYASRYIYYVNKNDANQVYTEYIDMDKMRGRFKETLDVLKKMNSDAGQFIINANPEGDQTTDSTDNNNNQTQVGAIDTSLCDYIEDGAEEDELPYHGLTSADIRSDVASLLLEVQEGVYSLNDLRKILENVNMQREDIEDLIMALELQIEASEKGESSNKLKDEDAYVARTAPIRDKMAANNIKMNVEGYIDLADLFKKITKTLIAQDDPVMRVITEIARKEQEPQLKDRGILITGSTGCGKSKMVNLIAKYLDRPFIKIDSTQLTVPGYVGKDIEEFLWDLYVKCGKNKEKAEQAIVYFEEIDKKGSSDKGDVSGRGVLNVLLPFIEGSTYGACENIKRQDAVVQLSTKNMTVLLGGAFEDVYKHLTEKGSIGFGSDNVGKRVREATPDDFVEKAQMPSEFMGRVSIVKLNDLDVQAVKRVLLESDESAIKIQERLFKQLGVKLTAGDDYISTIAEQAVKRKTGARGLNTVVDETTWKAYNDAYMHLGEYEEIILSSETVNDPANYQKVLKKKTTR